MAAWFKRLRQILQWPKWRSTKGQRFVGVSWGEEVSEKVAIDLIDVALDKTDFIPVVFNQELGNAYVAHVYVDVYMSHTKWSDIMLRLIHKRVLDPSLPWFFAALLPADVFLRPIPRGVLEWSYSQDPEVTKIPSIEWHYSYTIEHISRDVKTSEGVLNAYADEDLCFSLGFLKDFGHVFIPLTGIGVDR